MAATQTPTPEPALTAEDALRKRLLGRIAVAAVIIVGLLGSLAVFDALYAPATPVKVASAPPLLTPPPAAEPVPAAAAPVTTAPAAEPPKEADAAAKPADSTPAAEAAASTPATGKIAKATPEQTSSPGAPPLTPLPAEKPLTKPAAPRQAMIRPSEPAERVAPPVAVRPDPQREIARAPYGGNHNAPASRPLSQPLPTANRQFALQLGVFNNLANAEDLRAKLELHGIPSTIEARVQVGPFSSRDEIDAARAKLKALGIDSGIMVSSRK